jgi:hypothetical protein
LEAHYRYRLPEDLARHASKERFAPDELLRGACRSAGEGLGREDARGPVPVGGGDGSWGWLNRYVKMEPGIHGFGVNLNKVLSDVAAR